MRNTKIEIDEKMAKQREIASQTEGARALSNVVCIHASPEGIYRNELPTIYARRHRLQ